MRLATAITRPAASIWSGCRIAWQRTAPALIDLVYAPRCVHCLVDLEPRGDAILLCAACRQAISPPVAAWCRRCGAPLTGQPRDISCCVRCQQRRLPWKGVVALGRYDGDLKRAVVRAKSFAGEPLATALGQLLAHHRAEPLRQFAADRIVPVPLYWSRRIRRGANGPDRIAAALSQDLGIPLDTKSLRRRRLTPLQVDVTHVQRGLVQRRSFRVRSNRQIHGKRLLLVDDILTTGATAHAATQALLEAGAAEVLVAIVARAISESTT